MWTCQVCRTEHRWYNEVCDHCCAFNGSAEFQWMCGECEVDNVLTSDHCRTCDTKRNWKYVSDYNWECHECKNVNSFNDKKCRNCKSEGRGFVPRRLEKIDQCRLDEHSIGETFQCGICKSKLEAHEQIADIPCGHVFHIGCLFKWVTSDNENSSKCPNCRFDIPLKRITHLLNNDEEDEQEYSYCECCGGEE